jgi:hypothetical protein
MIVEKSSRPISCNDLVFEEQGKDIFVVMSKSADKLLICNIIGRWVLEQCDGSHDVAEMKAFLSSSYPNINHLRISTDLDSFLETAAGLGAISWQ